MKYPAFAVIYHYKSQRDDFKYDGQFSANLKIVYIKDDPYNKEKLMGLELIGYWSGVDVDSTFLEFVKSKIRG